MPALLSRLEGHASSGLSARPTSSRLGPPGLQYRHAPFPSFQSSRCCFQHSSCHNMHRPAAAAASQQPGSVANDATGLAGLFITMMQQAMEAQNQQISSQPGANILLQDLAFHPPGAEKPLLSGVNLHLQANQLGLIIGRSGSGKTTLLQLLAGLSDQTGGSVYISRNTLATTAAALGAGAASGPPAPPAAAAGDAGTAVAVPAGSLGFCPVPNLPPACHIEERMKQVGAARLCVQTSGQSINQASKQNARPAMRMAKQT